MREDMYLYVGEVMSGCLTGKMEDKRWSTVKVIAK